MTEDFQGESCICLMGMAGAGKTTLGRMLARRLDWAFLDTDHLIESYYGLPLQQVLDNHGLEEFLRIEDYLVSILAVQRTVISTGGSVVYGRRAVERLKLLGRIVMLDIDLQTFRRRVGRAENRGLAIAKGACMDDLFWERKPLYEAVADLTVSTDRNSPEKCLDLIEAWIKE